MSNDNLFPESHKYTISQYIASGRKTDEDVIIDTLDSDYIEGVIQCIYIYFCLFVLKGYEHAYKTWVCGLAGETL